HMEPAIFLDRDGVINENRPDHVKSWAEFQFLPGVFDALRQVHQTNWRVFVITNQAIVSRNIVTAATINAIHYNMRCTIERHGGYIHEISYCPHSDHEKCSCRKPQPGLILQLAQKWQIDLQRSVVIGDALSDMAAAQAANCRTIMVRS